VTPTVLPRHVRHGATATGQFGLEISAETAGWGYSGLRVLSLDAGGQATFATGDDEVIVLPLSGSGTVTCDGEMVTLQGRPSPFAAVSDFAYLPRDAAATVESATGGRFALPSARATQRLPFRYGAAVDVPVELRGAGQASRQVNNFCAPDAFAADRLIAVEVLTPGGNWSSYPPHKHDVESDTESALEEIYYFEVADAPKSRPGVGRAYQRVYPSGPDRMIDVCVEVATGDVVLIPHGYHGPSMAAPGYDLYYLNVMAGPGERVWRFCDDPRHAWIRDSWDGVPVDPRLPLTTANTKDSEVRE
jgi:5-deoxy-glucuronate isomerase